MTGAVIVGAGVGVVTAAVAVAAGVAVGVGVAAVVGATNGAGVGSGSCGAAGMLVGAGVDDVIGVGAGIRAGVFAKLKLAGFLDLAELQAGAGVSVGARIGLADPDPSDGRLYLDELFRDADNRPGNFLGGVLDVSLEG